MNRKLQKGDQVKEQRYHKGCELV